MTVFIPHSIIFLVAAVLLIGPLIVATVISDYRHQISRLKLQLATRWVDDPLGTGRQRALRLLVGYIIHAHGLVHTSKLDDDILSAAWAGDAKALNRAVADADHA